jgi:lysophospholipase L1-like esterase
MAIAISRLAAVGIAVGAGFALAAPAAHRHRNVRLVASLVNATMARRAGLPARTHWVATWSASPQAATHGALSATGFHNQTVRNVVFTSAGGSDVRVLMTNAFGTSPLQVGHAAIGVRGPGAAVARNQALSFHGRRSVVIRPGAAVLSDPVPLQVQPLQALAVSIFLPDSTGPATQHPLAEQVNYVAGGDHALDPGGRAFGTRTYSWYFVSGVDVLAPARNRGTVVALGDSITDGVNSRVNADGRWPNDLARRLDRPGATMSVVDEGIGGNRVLDTSPCCGQSAIARFRRDVQRRAGVRTVILLEGVNDIDANTHAGAASAPHADISAQQIIVGYRKLIALAHRAHLKIFGGTITPFRGARYWSAQGELKRETVNQWILDSGAFDGVIDFAKALDDPLAPETLNSAFDSGDHLHPNRAGYQAMADAIDLQMLLDPS